MSKLPSPVKLLPAKTAVILAIVTVMCGSTYMNAQGFSPSLSDTGITATAAAAADTADSVTTSLKRETDSAKEDSLLQMLNDVDADLDELRNIETQVYHYADEGDEDSISNEILQGKVEHLREYEIQMLNMLGFNSGSLDMQIMQVQENVNSLEQEKRDLIEQLIKEKIKINKELPFLEREVSTTSRMQMLKYEEYIERFPTSEFTDNIYFRLADYYYRTANEKYERDMERYEGDYDEYAQAESLFDAGILPELPEMPAFPEKNFSKSRDMCRRIIDGFPESDVRDDALFNIGFFFEEEMKRDAALPYYKLLVKEFPESRYVPEAYLRIGEYYFDNPDADSGTGLEQAITAYKSIMKFWMHPNFSLAIYKLGWTYYRLFDYANAISYFIFLIEDSRAVKDADVDGLKDSYDLDKEALRYVAMSFKEDVSEEQLFSPEPWAGVPEKTKQFVMKLGDKDYAPTILEELGNIYREVDQSIGAIESYRALLDLFPGYRNANVIQQQVINLYDAMASDPEVAKKYGKDWAMDQANEERLVLFKTYGKAWADTIQDTKKREEVIKAAKDAIYYVAVHNFEKAQKSKAAADYDRAIALFREYLQDFPDGEQSYEIRWIIASILDTELKRMDEAYNEYFRVSQDRNFDKHREEAATNAIALTQDMMKVEAARLVDDSLAQKEVNPAEKKYIHAIDNFIRLLPEHADVPVMLYNKASLYYNKGKYDDAKVVYDELLRLYPKRKESIEALKLIATAYSKRGHYERAIEWFKRWRDTSEKGEDRQLANNLIAQCLRDIALRHQQAGQHLEAAKAFERVVGEQPNYQFAPQTLFDAAKEYEAVKDYRKAAVVYQQIVMNYPSVKDAPAALWNAALAYDKNGDKRQAAQLYEQLAKIYPTYENVSAAIYTAAVKYEELEDWRNAARVFEWFVQQYPEDKENREFLFTAGKYYGKVGDERKAKEVYAVFSERFPDDVRVIEIKYDLAMAVYKKKKMDDAKARFYDVIAAFEAAGSPADFRGRAAEASFIIAELDYKEYSDIKFTLPKDELDRNFKKKLKMLEDINGKYANVVQYGIINWAPQSVYKIARNIEEFANTYEQQEVPAGLEHNELIETQKKIKLNLTGMLEKAIDPYQATIDLSSQLKGESTDTLIAPWVIKAKLKKLETVYRIALAKKQAQMMELNLLRPDTSSTAWVKNMQTYTKVAGRLSKLVPVFERVFNVAGELGIDVLNPGMIGQEDVSVSMDEMMRVMMSPEEREQLEAAAAADDKAARTASAPDSGGVPVDTAANSDSTVPADSTVLVKAAPGDTLAADSARVRDSTATTDSTVLAVAAEKSAEKKYKIDVDVSGSPEGIAIVNNSKVELSHLLYLAGDLSGKGALELLRSPVPEQFQNNPMLLTEYNKQIAQNAIKFIQPGIAAFNQGLMTAAEYNIQSQWVDKSKADLLRNSNIGPGLFSELSLASLKNYREFAGLYRRLYETGDVTESGQDAYAVEGLVYQFSDYGVLFAKVALQSYQATLDLAMENEIDASFLRSTYVDLAKFAYLAGSGYQSASADCRRVASMYSEYAAGDTANTDSFAVDLDPVVAEDLAYVFEENTDIFYDNCVELYEIGYEMITAAGIKNEWQMKIQQQLALLLPDIYGEPEKLDYYSEHVVSGSAIKTYPQSDSMWTGIYYADSAWSAAVQAQMPGNVTGFDSSAAVPIWDRTGSDTAYFRKLFSVGGSPKKAELTITAADNFRLFVNNEYIARDDTLPGDWQENKKYDLTEFLYEGENLLAIQADKADSTVFGLQFDLYYKYGVKHERGETAVDGNKDGSVNPDTSAAVPDSAASPMRSVRTDSSGGVPDDTVAAVDSSLSDTAVIPVAGNESDSVTAFKPGSDTDPVCVEREKLAKTGIEIEKLKIEGARQAISNIENELQRLRQEVDSLTGEPQDTDGASGPPPVPDAAPGGGSPAEEETE